MTPFFASECQQTEIGKMPTKWQLLTFNFINTLNYQLDILYRGRQFEENDRFFSFCRFPDSVRTAKIVFNFDPFRMKFLNIYWLNFIHQRRN